MLPIRDAKAVRWRTIIGFVILMLAMMIFTNQFVFASGLFTPLFTGMNNATHGLINSNLLNQIPDLIIVVFCVFFWLAKLRPHDLGLRWRDIPAAALVILPAWAIMQIIAGGASLLTTGTLIVAPDWGTAASWKIGALIGHLFGVALFEEIHFRGFLLVQLGLKFGAKNSREGLIRALVITAVIFTLMHIPNQIMLKTPFPQALNNLTIIFWWGLSLGAIYLKTGNLFIAVGVHALINAPTMLFESPLVPQIAVTLAVIIVLAQINRRRSALNGEISAMF
jgi:uncharacterized protein